jgi:predicted nucleic acid-binding Zn ribbon protein
VSASAAIAPSESRKFDGPNAAKMSPSVAVKVDRLVSAPAIQFKGSGWYVNDYGRGSGSSGKDTGSSEGSKSDGDSKDKSKDKAEVKSDSKTSDSKSEGKGPSTSSEKKKPAAKSK